MASIRVGIGGWTFAPWRGRFFPAGLPHAQELDYASRHLTSIEINGTFYRHQSPASFAAWRDATPEDFVFAVKAHRATTHGKLPAEAGPAVDRFLASGLLDLGAKLGPILWQFPHNKKFDPTGFEAFLQLLPAALHGIPLRHAIEARHPSFEDPTWIEMLRTHNVAAVIVDSDKQSLRGDITADFIYARLQRNTEDTPEGYDSTALDEWSIRLKHWSTGKPVTDLTLTAPKASGKPKPMDCFAYFISGDKQRAPDAAKAMLGRQGK